MRKGMLAGSFDPFTVGHADLVRRGLELFDEVVIAVGYNEHKQGWIPVQERVCALQELYRDEPRVSVESYSCLTVDFMKEKGARFLIRGVRNAMDYEYEMQLADVNRKISETETVLLPARPTLSCISSSMVRELAHFGRDISEFQPAGLSYNTLEKK